MNTSLPQRDSLQSKVEALQAEVERLTKERDQSREQTTAAIEDYNDELSARRAAEAQVQSLTQALGSLLSLCEAGGDPFDEPGRPTVNAARTALAAARAALEASEPTESKP